MLLINTSNKPASVEFGQFVGQNFHLFTKSLLPEIDDIVSGELPRWPRDLGIVAAQSEIGVAL